MQRNVIETIMGGVVLLVAVVFLVFAYTSSGVSRVSGYEITAKFNRVDGLATGSEVRMSGIKIGSILGQELDPQTYLAVVRMSIDEKVRLPADTTAKVQSDGLLGGSYMVLEAGADEQMIGDGGEIIYTQDPVNLVDLIGRFIFSAGEVGGGKKSGGGQSSGTAEEPAAPSGGLLSQ